MSLQYIYIQKVSRHDASKQHIYRQDVKTQDKMPAVRMSLGEMSLDKKTYYPFFVSINVSLLF